MGNGLRDARPARKHDRQESIDTERLEGYDSHKKLPLDRLDKLMAGRFPNFLSNPKVLLDVGKEAVSKELARLKETGSLNGAEESVLNQIFALLAEASLHPSGARQSGELHPPATASQRPPAGNALRRLDDNKE